MTHTLHLRWRNVSENSLEHTAEGQMHLPFWMNLFIQLLFSDLSISKSHVVRCRAYRR